jgi:hypothetical protein
MKWFHHECAAKFSPKLAALGATLGLEGFGLYWNLLEQIGFHSDTFRLKVTGIIPEADNRFEEVLNGSGSLENIGWSDDPNSIPQVADVVLARATFASPEQLRTMISEIVRLKLFDESSWREYGILFSPGFEKRADDYTKRHGRSARQDKQPRSKGQDFPRPDTGHSPDTVRTISDKVLPEQKREEENSGEENNSEEEEKKLMLLNNNTNNDEELNDEEFRRWCVEIKRTILSWNESHASKCDWFPQERELRKLLTGGSRLHRQRQCYDAINILGLGVTYPRIVCRAVQLMLEASARKRIANPFGWIWTALNGNGEGTAPWVNMLTADEERQPRSAARCGCS